MSFVCVPSAELPVMVSAKNEEHAVGTDKHGVVAASRNFRDAFSFGAFNFAGPKHPLGVVAKPQLPVIIATEAKNMVPCRKDDSVVISAT